MHQWRVYTHCGKNDGAAEGREKTPHKIKSRMASATVLPAVAENRGMMPDGLAFSVTCRRGIREAAPFVHFLLVPLFLLCWSDDNPDGYHVFCLCWPSAVFFYRFSLSLSLSPWSLSPSISVRYLLFTFLESATVFALVFQEKREKERRDTRGGKSSILCTFLRKKNRVYIFYTTLSVSNAMCRNIKQYSATIGRYWNFFCFFFFF